MMRNDKVITYIELVVNPEFISEVLPKATETRDKILLENGCEMFNLTRKLDDLNTVIIFAVYTSRQAYDWHLGQDYVKSFFTFLQGKLTTAPINYNLEAI